MSSLTFPRSSYLILIVIWVPFPSVPGCLLFCFAALRRRRSFRSCPVASFHQPLDCVLTPFASPLRHLPHVPSQPRDLTSMPDRASSCHITSCHTDLHHPVNRFRPVLTWQSRRDRRGFRWLSSHVRFRPFSIPCRVQGSRYAFLPCVLTPSAFPSHYTTSTPASSPTRHSTLPPVDGPGTPSHSSPYACNSAADPTHRILACCIVLCRVGSVGFVLD